MLKYREKIFLVFFSLSSPAYALPLPEFASAVVGVGELFLILLAGLSIYFPFIKIRKNKKKFFPYFTWGIIVILAALLLAPEKINYLFEDNESLSQETRFGMIMKKEDREKDSYSISEIDAYKLMLEQKSKSTNKYIFIDARSRAETELGTAEGFTKISWADLAESYQEQIKGKTIIASCWTGMRGSEVCSKLREKGIDCKYLENGLKAWTESGLPLSLSPNVSKNDFGTAESFPDYGKLLSAREAVSIKQKGATIVDIRNPDLFKKEHIPGAVNIPFSDLPVNELEYQIKTLPPGGVVVACYGEISCSEAGLLGWEINRTGAKYFGAYAGKTKAFTQAYDGMNNPKQSVSINSYLTKKTVPVFSYLESHTNFTFLILISSIFLGLLLWFTKEISIIYFLNLKQRKQKNYLLKNLLNGDTFALKRENYFDIKSYFKNAFKSLIPLILTLIYGFIIQLISLSWGKSKFFGQTNWQELDRFSILSIVSSVLVTISITFIIFNNKLNYKKSAVSIPIFLITLFFINNLPKISILMLTLSLLIMYAIQMLKMIKEKYNNTLIIKQYQKGYISLKNAHKVISKDTKAGRLSFLINKGFKVPNGFVVRAGNIDRLSSSNENTITDLLGKEFAVRSSALKEDMKDSSQAGLHLSIIPSKKQTWKKDMREVFNSYASNNKNEIILLQKCINPVFSGVIFSKHPQWGGVILLEWGNGLSAKRMDGSEIAHQIVINRSNGEIVYSTNNYLKMHSYVLSIYELLLNVENIYNEELDIEWAIDSEGLWLLQARPQSALNNLDYNTIEQDREKLLKPQFEDLNTCELSFIMQKCTRLSASLICELWENSSSADYASRLALWKWNKPINKQNAYIYSFGRIWNSNYPLMNKPNKISWLAAKNQFKENLQDINEESKKVLQETNIHIAIDWSLLKQENWIRLWSNSLNNWKRMQVFSFYFEFMAQIAIEEVLKECNNIGLNGEKLISNGANAFFSKDISYRAENDYEISFSRHIEQGKSFDNDLQNQLFGFLEHSESKDLPNKINKGLKDKILFARQLVYLREEAKHNSLNTFYLLRVAILDAQKRLNLNEEIFEMEYSEIENIFSSNKEEFKNKLKNRLADKEIFKKYNLPNILDANSVATLGRNEVENILINDSSNTKGRFVSNPSNLEGTLLIINEGLSAIEIDKLLSQYGKNSVIYSKFISAHLVNIGRDYCVKSFCSNYGSVLSHPSVLAREANLPFLIGIKIPEDWHNGDSITIFDSGEIIKN